MKVPLLDLKKQYQAVRDEIVSAAVEVFESQYFIGGPRVEEFEGLMADYCGCGYAVGVSSGSDALLISLMEAGIGHGDMVITTPYTFFATVGAVARVGAIPVFADIDKHTYNIDPVKIKELVKSLDKDRLSKLKAILPVHLFGQCADMEPILNIAEEYGLIVIEDAAQAIGAEYRFSDGTIKRAGAMGDYGCFSFYPTKNLGAFGEGGMVTCNCEDTSNRLKTFRNHGDIKRYQHQYVGGNFRLDALQAAILTIKLKHLDDWSNGRIRNAGLYRELLESNSMLAKILPENREVRHIYNQFVIDAGEKRDSLMEYLREKGVGCEVYYPIPQHMQECFRDLGYCEGDFPASEDAAKKSLAIPVYAELTEDQIRYVVDILSDFYS